MRHWKACRADCSADRSSSFSSPKIHAVIDKELMTWKRRALEKHGIDLTWCREGDPQTNISPEVSRPLTSFISS